jgi:hypothetical protein
MAHLGEAASSPLQQEPKMLLTSVPLAGASFFQRLPDSWSGLGQAGADRVACGSVACDRHQYALGAADPHTHRLPSPLTSDPSPGNNEGEDVFLAFRAHKGAAPLGPDARSERLNLIFGHFRTKDLRRSAPKRKSAKSLGVRHLLQVANYSEIRMNKDSTSD